MNDAAALDTEAASGHGPSLRRAREAQGLTAQQAAERLNLDVAVVSALECDDFAALGAPVFAKGHLRRYGALLGLAEEPLLAAYEQARGQPEAPSLVPRARTEMMPARSRPKWPWAVGGALLFLLAAALVAYVSEYGLNWPARGSAPVPSTAARTPADDSSSPPPVALDVDRGAPAQGESVPSAAPAEAGVAIEQATMPVPPGHVSISMAFAADSWAEVRDAGGKAVLYDLGRAGTQRSIAAAAPLSVTIGNAPAVTLVVNGRPAVVPAVAGGGTVARFRVEADGTVR